MATNRTPPKKKARELAKYLRAERPDYAYLKGVFRALREELEIQVPRRETRLPEVPTEEEMRHFYQVVWNCRNFGDMVLIKTLFYTGVRVSELVAIRLDEVDVERCQIRITQGKGSKDRQVPFPLPFRELLALHMEQMRTKGANYLFESVRKRKYTDRGVRKMLARYARAAGITRSTSPHKWRHFLFTWLKKEGIDDALIHLTPGMPRASRWRSTLSFLWLMHNLPTTRQWSDFLSSNQLNKTKGRRRWRSCSLRCGVPRQPG